MNNLCFAEINSPLTKDNVEQLAEFDQSFFPQPWSKEDWSSLFHDFNPKLYILKSRDDKIVGVCLFDILAAMSQAHLYKIAIHKSFRNQGIAWPFFQKSMDAVKLFPVSNCFLEVSVENINAVKMYRAFGFEILTTKKRFYSNGEDAYAMQVMFE